MALEDIVVSDIVAGYYGSVMMNAYYCLYLSHVEQDSKKNMFCTIQSLPLRACFGGGVCALGVLASDGWQRSCASERVRACGSEVVMCCFSSSLEFISFFLW